MILSIFYILLLTQFLGYYLVVREDDVKVFVLAISNRSDQPTLVELEN